MTMASTPKSAARRKRALRELRSERPGRRPAHPIVGRVVEVAGGEATIAFNAAGVRERRRARSTIPISATDIGKDVVVTFAEGDVEQAIILGVLQPLPSHPSAVRAKLDDDKLVLTAGKEIVLECGEASITLTRAGKVLIRGAYLLSRSSGVNRIKGGSVEIN